MNTDLLVPVNNGRNARKESPRRKDNITRVFQGEDGLTTIEIVLLIFVAVLILLAIVAYFNDTVYAKVKSAIESLLGKTVQ